jgi:hypothetical protein
MLTGPPGQLVQALVNDPHALAHLLHAHQVTIVAVAHRPDRHLELELIVDQVRLGLAQVVIDAAAAEVRPVRP